MSAELLGEGDRLVSISAAGAGGPPTYQAGKHGCISIAVRRLPGPMGWYLVANIVFEKGPDSIIPLHTAEEFRVLNP